MKLVRKSYFENSICKKGGRIIVFYINIYIYIYIYIYVGSQIVAQTQME